MKIIFTFLFLASGFFYSQEKAVTAAGKIVSLNNDGTWQYEGNNSMDLKPEDFKTENNKTSAGLLEGLKINVENGEGNNVAVEFAFLSTADQFNKLSFEKINKMIKYSRGTLLLGLKNKYSFIPRKLRISYSDEHQKWAVVWEYTAKNSFGGDTEGTDVRLYDYQLKEIEI